MKRILIISLMFGLIGTLNLAAYASSHHDDHHNVITKERATELAKSFVERYMPEYIIADVDKEDGGEIYLVTIKRQNGAELQMKIHGHDGEVLYLYP